MCKHLTFWCYVHNALQRYAGLCLSLCLWWSGAEFWWFEGCSVLTSCTQLKSSQSNTTSWLATSSALMSWSLLSPGDQWISSGRGIWRTKTWGWGPESPKDTELNMAFSISFPLGAPESWIFAYILTAFFSQSEAELWWYSLNNSRLSVWLMTGCYFSFVVE